MARLLLLGFVLCAAVALTVQAALPPAKYTDKYDNVNLDRILSNGRILTNYIKCLMDEGPCTSEGRELKSKFLTPDIYIKLPVEKVQIIEKRRVEGFLKKITKKIFKFLILILKET